MEKYLGNKRALLRAIDEVIDTHCPGAKSICDLLAGTTNVARYFRRHGFQTSSNDINRFSFVLGATYLALSSPPQFSGLTLSSTPASATKLIREHYDTSVRRDGDALFTASRAEVVWKESDRATAVLAWLNSNGDRRKRSSGRIERYFCAEGRDSGFRSRRGSTGRRNYFSLENAQKLDWILDRVRDWYQEQRISFAEACFIMCSVLEEVVIVANVNGTFHDFNRDELWPNSLQPLTLRLPLASYDGPVGTVYCDDAFALGAKLPRHDVVYIDPPYNFRQYSAYYHLLNLIAAWPFLPDLDGYLAELEFVRGQNMADDFTSPLCFRDEFVVALKRLVESTNARWVVLSYFGGRNHWNHWSRCETPRDDGARYLAELFGDRTLFSSNLTVPVLGKRLNYQSRVGEKKILVNEHLFVGERIARRRPRPRSESHVSDLNARFGLFQFTPEVLRSAPDHRKPGVVHGVASVAGEKFRGVQRKDTNIAELS